MTQKYEQEFTIKPVGIVHAEPSDPSEISIYGLKKDSYIEIFPEYQQALTRIEENSHLWILLWFHQANRSMLKMSPGINRNLPEYGVFSLRAPHRPNPIALTHVYLERCEGCNLYVSGLDAIDGTPVLDIKPYHEGDIIFEPRTPYMPPARPAMRRDRFFKQALEHHKEICIGLWMGVRMALVAEEFLGHLNREDVLVEVTGSRCLADVVQGLSRARLANPARFSFQESSTIQSSRWTKKDRRIELTARSGYSIDQWENGQPEDLFIIQKD
ncbi:MAG TPA: tRNA (N6-threonylcarbamoyladenosine(37)-N6)-methyltransferase TrmO [Syntrophomonadaceae bacterium]|nr:tRNA (N6-threonylcarbamoyladenosine(37)-N6)-methyltransferase TrmO [Syntrophomonadaceae bacterium]